MAGARRGGEGRAREDARDGTARRWTQPGQDRRSRPRRRVWLSLRAGLALQAGSEAVAGRADRRDAKGGHRGNDRLSPGEDRRQGTAWRHALEAAVLREEARLARDRSRLGDRGPRGLGPLSRRNAAARRELARGARLRRLLRVRLLAVLDEDLIDL